MVLVNIRSAAAWVFQVMSIRRPVERHPSAAVLLLLGGRPEIPHLTARSRG